MGCIEPDGESSRGLEEEGMGVVVEGVSVDIGIEDGTVDDAVVETGAVAPREVDGAVRRVRPVERNGNEERKEARSGPE